MINRNKKLITTLIATIVAVSNFGPSTAYAFEEISTLKESEKQILFETSFEDSETDKNFLTSTIDKTKGSKNIDGLEKEYVIDGSINDKIVLSSIQSSTKHNNNEIAENLFDDSTNTKFLGLNSNGVSEEKPVWVEFNTTEEVTIDRYQVVSANDAQERDPKNWNLYGSKDGVEWVSLDSQSDQVFNNRFERKEYRIDNTEAYKYFRFEITEIYKKDGQMCQWSELTLGTGIKNEEEEVEPSMTTQITKGPTGTWNHASGKGWTGARAVEVSGTHLGNEKAYSYNVIYEDLNIKVDKDTRLSYTIFPSMLDESNYDYDFTQMHIAVDIEFTDGTFLSDLGAIDQYDTNLHPQSQGDSKVLTTNQWNYISSKIGDVAKGKTIKNILIAYDNDINPKEVDAKFKTYIDDLKIYKEADKEYKHKSDYVNILRGTNDSPAFSRGLTAPAVVTPHGFNFFAPATTESDNKIYNYQDTKLKHITISHEPSYWVGDRGTWQFMINTSIDINNVTNGSSINASARQAEFSHENEVAKAHYYGVTFDEGSNASNSKMEVTPTEHGAVTRFTFDKDSENRNIIFDCTRASGTLVYNEDGSFEATSNHTSNGMQKMYVYGEFSEKPTATKVQNNKQGIASFEDDVVEVKLATSFISIEQAKKNLQLEIKESDDFDSIFEQAQDLWDETLDFIDVKGASEDQLVTLYSNVYRLNAYPNLLSENTGTNENPDWKYKSPYNNNEVVDGTLYYNNGFWDTYRTAWAAYGLFTPNKATELLNGLVQHYNDNGYVPRWIAPGGTNSMVGTSSDVIFGDAIAKGIDFDWQGAYESAIKNAAVAVDSNNLTNGGRAQLNRSIFEGYTAHDLQHEGFSWSIEGYINDYGVYQLANSLGYEDEAAYYLNRSLNYSKLFKSTGDDVTEKWLRGRNANGDWSYSDENFNPFFWGDDYTETNAFNMSVSVTQDGQGLANLYGGRDALAEKIDTIFNTNGDYWGYGANESIGGIHEQKEAREIKLGQYGHSNQPSHHIPYMYNYAGQPWKTQMYVRDVLDRAYVGSDFAQGYIGDEDNGEMSAWYIFSALGFYPVSMGSDEYAIGSPLFDEMTVTLDNGKKIKVKAKNNSDENVYIQSMKLNGKNYNKSYIKHSDLEDGAVIEFEMGNTPNVNWGTGEEDLPTSITKGDELPNPLEDITIPEVEVSDKVENEISSDTVYSNVEGVTGLFDNNSNTAVNLNTSENTEIIYSFILPREISMLTLTSAREGNAPTGYILSGSNDGENWEVVDERSDLQFEWQRYTRPFKLDEEKTNAYMHYKLELIGGSALAEVELLGQESDNSSIDITMLNKKISAAKAIDQSNFPQPVRDLLNNAIDKAELVANNENSTEEEIVNAYNDLSNVIKRVNSIRLAKDRIEAEEFNDAHSNIVNDGNNIGGVKKGSWVKYNDIVFDGNENGFEIFYAGQNKDAGGYVEIYFDSMDSEAVAKLDLPTTGDNWSNYVLIDGELNKEFEAGLHDVYLVFKNDTNLPYVANVDYFRFLDTRANVDELVSAMEKAEAIEEIKYTEDSYNVLKEALEAAKILVENPKATQQEVDEATKNIELAINSLVKRAEYKVHLEIAVDVAKLVTEGELSNVVPVVAEEFKAALAEAEILLADINATQEEVDNSFDRLSKVMQMLEFKKGDKKSLTALISKINGLDGNEYISETWDKLQQKLKSSEEVVADENALEAEVVKSYEELLRSFLELRLKPSKDKLDDLINKAKGIERALYTEASLKALDEALVAASMVSENKDAKLSEITNAENNLKIALNSLEQKVSNENNTGDGNNSDNGDNKEEEDKKDDDVNNNGSTNGSNDGNVNNSGDENKQQDANKEIASNTVASSSSNVKTNSKSDSKQGNATKLPNTGGVPGVAIALAGLITSISGLGLFKRKK